MDKKKFYILLNDDVVEKENSQEVEKEDNLKDKENEVKDVEKESKETEKKKKEVKKDTEIKITKNEYEEYKKLKLSSMTSEEREKTLQDENENLLLKIESLEKLVEEQLQQVEQIKTQQLIKEKIVNIKNEKPYLVETLEKKEKDGFKSVEELDKFVNLVDSDTLKNAFEITKKVNYATKINNKTFSNDNSNVNTINKTNFDLRKYGIKK